MNIFISRNLFSSDFSKSYLSSAAPLWSQLEGYRLPDSGRRRPLQSQAHRPESRGSVKNGCWMLVVRCWPVSWLARDLPTSNIQHPFSPFREKQNGQIL